MFGAAGTIATPAMANFLLGRVARWSYKSRCGW